MANPLKSALRTVVFRLESATDALVGREANPFYHLGALSWFFFWIVAATGIYLFIPYETSAVRAWNSIDHITRVQWYWGGLMRSLHRYGSDAMVLTMLAHLLREWALDRYHGARWFAWFTGVPLIWMVLASGITGYWLIWDMLAQYLAIGTMEWMDWLNIFGQSVARNFLMRGSLTDRFFTLLIFIHIAVPLFTLFLMWIHILRVNRADVNPPRQLAIGTLLMLVVLSLVFPAPLGEPADLGKTTAVINPDWYFMALYPVFDTWGPKVAWAASAGLTLVLGIMPWTTRFRRPQAAKVQPADCNGCGNCASDCPFGAVTIRPRTDGSPHREIAVVQPDICTGCGICVASCPRTNPFRPGDELTTGIDLPSLAFDKMRKRAVAAAEKLKGPSRIMVVGCDHAAKLDRFEGPSVAALSLPCAGMLPPSLVDFLLTKGKIDGVIVTGCRPGECFHRLGPQWTGDRFAGERTPKLRKAVPREQVRISWAAPTEHKLLEKEIAEFQAELRTSPAKPAPVEGAAE